MWISHTFMCVCKLIYAYVCVLTGWWVCPLAAKKAEVKVKPLFNLLRHTTIVCKQKGTMTSTHGDEKELKLTDTKY